MEGEEGEGLRLSKRFNDKAIGSGEVDYKTKAGTAWSHSYLNQKPWHPLSYPNQRRKWIAEQVNAERERRSADVAREYAQEQEFFRQTALVSKKEKEKMEMMKAVSFMYVRPPGYNAESAKAAEIADEKRKQDQSDPTQGSSIDGASTLVPPEPKDHSAEQKKKPRPKDVFGRPLPTEEEFGVLKNAPRLETGVAGRVKPFAIEVRNVKCVRCGTYGHQSGDRECPLKDAIMPNEESRLKRDDPLTAILAHTDPTEPLKWELKQKPGMSPPRGGFNPDDPNHQIVSEVIFDEYGGFLGADNVPDLLTNFSAGKSRRKKSSRKQRRGRDEKDRSTSPQKNRDGKSWKDKKRHKKHDRSYSRSSDDSEVDEKHNKRSRHKHSYPSNDSDMDRQVDKELHYRNGRKPSYSSKHSDVDRLNRSKRNKQSYSSDSERIKRHRRERSRQGRSHAHSSDDSDLRDSEGVMYHGRERSRQDHSRGHSSDDSNSSNAEGIKCHRRERSRQNHSRAHSSNDSGSSGSQDIKRHRRERSGQYPSHVHSSNDSGSSDSEGIKRHRCERSRQGRARAYSTDDSDCGGRQRSKHRY